MQIQYSRLRWRFIHIPAITAINSARLINNPNSSLDILVGYLKGSESC